MKKRIFQVALLSMFVFYASCSSESDVATQNSSTNSSILKSNGLSEKELAEAKVMYNDMVLTAEYKTFDLSLKDFREKLVLQSPPFTTKAEAMVWINNNLSNTNFSSVNEFESHLDYLAGAMESIRINNKGLFNHFGNATGGQTSQIVKPITPVFEYPSTTTACLDGCIGSFESGQDAANALYDRSTDIHISDEDGAGFANILAAFSCATAADDLEETMNGLYADYNLCAGACGSGN